MLNFLDSNVWIALIWDRHVHAEQARLWFERCRNEYFYFCRFTQITVLRLLTTEQVMGSDTKTMAQAWRIWDELASDSQIEFLAEPEEIETLFRSRSNLASASPKVWADAYQLAFASATGMRFVTFDRALKSNNGEVLVL